MATPLEKRVALVIGNGAYPSAPLLNPVNDAKDMATSLRALGFNVIERINANQKEMNRAITTFGESLSKDTVALFYYAGHGMQVRGKNYLIPVDAQIATENSVRSESVDVDGLLDQLTASDLNIVVLDACRNNPFERKFRALGGAGLAQMDAPKGTLIAYATAPGKTASDGEGRNGLFTGELLRQIRIPGLTIEQVFKNVRREVTKTTRDNQTPWESSSLTGDFYFSSASASKTLPSSPPVAVASISVAPQRPTPSIQDDKLAPATPSPTLAKPSAESSNPAATESQVTDEITWMWPTNNSVTRSFGESDSKGIQFSGEGGAPIHAAADGKVVYAGSGLRGYGEIIIIKHSATLLTAYAHQKKILVKEGQAVSRGQQIGEMGSTGTDSIKLLFEIRKAGKPVDPLLFLPFRPSSLAKQTQPTVVQQIQSDEDKRRFILAN